ncbi:hypothetical protein HKT18_03050 [Flavobacterium sp. IMCC34852]|uniref:Uncharacterized protein n=1 Tax=Flavobacterium rivulicola TaxID=2732161 RepID=A0A7Y3R7Y0_9FLAO|nr:hypothetical protein [Flavobacterium sp. IMCC34852]NNT71185.1 hypothetical protein [Flavobacterium sp. IMCC34852]
MKSVILLLFISFSVFCQNDKLYDISKYESNDLDREGEHLRKILNLKEDDVIVNLNNSKYVCLIDDNVFCKVICGNKLINTIKLDMVKSNLCKVYIKKLAELNPPELKSEEGKNGSRIRVEDGGEITIKIYKKNKKLVLYSYAPDTYIREEVPFFEKRKIFVECYSQLLSFFYDEEFYRVKALDTLYIYIERSKEEKKFANIEIINNTRSQEYQLSFGNLSVNFTNFFQRESVVLTMDKRKFLKKNNKIIRLEYLNKFCACDLDNLISTRSRLVYLVDNKDSTRRKVKIKKVIGGSLLGWNCYD